MNRTARISSAVLSFYDYLGFYSITKLQVPLPRVLGRPGTSTVAVMFAGIVTFQCTFPPSRFHSLWTLPQILSQLPPA